MEITAGLAAFSRIKASASAPTSPSKIKRGLAFRNGPRYICAWPVPAIFTDAFP